MQNLSAPFIFQEKFRMKIEHVLFASVFFFSKLGIRVPEGHFQCVHTIRTNKNRIRNGSCERAFDTFRTLEPDVTITNNPWSRDVAKILSAG